MSYRARGIKRPPLPIPETVKVLRKKRAFQALAKAEEKVAQSMDWDPSWAPAYNVPIPSGAPSGLYNISTGSKEYKFVDVNIATSGASLAVGLSASPTIQLLNGLQLGTAAYQRIGNKIAMKSLYWSLAYSNMATDSSPTTDTALVNVPVRAMVVYDKQTNGALPVLGDLLSAFAGLGNVTARAIDVNSPNNLNNRDRFIVLMDKRFILSSAGPSSRFIKKYKRLNTSVTYKSGATVGDVTDITSGGLYFITYRDAEMLGTTNPVSQVSLTGDIRLRYQDD